MSNTIAAAELIEERIASMQDLLEKQIQLRDKMIENGDDITDMNRIVEAAEAIIKTNKETAELIRRTAEDAIQDS